MLEVVDLRGNNLGAKPQMQSLTSAETLDLHYEAL